MSKPNEKPSVSSENAAAATAPAQRAEAPACPWCNSDSTEIYSQRGGETEWRTVTAPDGSKKSIEVKGSVKYCRCKRCRNTWTFFFTAHKL